VQVFQQGQYQSGSAYFYTRDHLGSIREMTDSSGTIVARYDYDPWGRVNTVIGTNKPDLNFTGLYNHAKSGLDMATYRVYDPDLGRWLSRDRVSEADGVNLFRYVWNDPIRGLDPLGLGTIYTDQTNGRTYFNPNPESPGPILSWPSRSNVVADSLPGASGPYYSPNVYPTDGPYKDDPVSYGPNDILKTDDPRGRWLHGGGRGLSDPFAPQQGWWPTHGCTRMQNSDIQDLVDHVRKFLQDNPGARLPYSRSAPPVGDFPNLIPGGAIG
jgi:RHS repeat-associated protein